MKTGDFHFQWFEKEDARKALRVSIDRNGKMHLGREMRRQLPPRIRVGFDAQSRMLAIVQGGEEDILWPKGGIFNMRRLSAQITALGLTLPVAFRMEDRPGEGSYYGTVLPRKKKQPAGPGGQAVYDVEQLMVLYRPMVDTLIYQTARTTPLAERKSCAWEAFCEAAQTYTAGQGDLGTYLAEQVRSALVRYNKPFVRAARERSLDAPLTTLRATRSACTM